MTMMVMKMVLVEHVMMIKMMMMMMMMMIMKMMVLKKVVVVVVRMMVRMVMTTMTTMTMSTMMIMVVVLVMMRIWMMKKTIATPGSDHLVSTAVISLNMISFIYLPPRHPQPPKPFSGLRTSCFYFAKYSRRGVYTQQALTVSPTALKLQVKTLHTHIRPGQSSVAQSASFFLCTVFLSYPSRTVWL